jgi:hypothetical protein
MLAFAKPDSLASTAASLGNICKAVFYNRGRGRSSCVSDIIYVDFSPDNPVQRSLTAIKKSKFKLEDLQTASINSDVLAYQIALCDVILYEILNIRSGLARRFGVPSSLSN